ncbi:MAG: hypothetical protein ACPGVT_03295 [Maricaulaceae bacterium]
MTDWYIKFIADNSDANGDFPPPWAAFPSIERYSIGWRMGSGEGWAIAWHDFLKRFETPEEIKSYLKRQRPAPMNWADNVASVLDTDAPEYDDDNHDAWVEAQQKALLKEGLIKSDAAYENWCALYPDIIWPWEHSETPKKCARYRTREFWFVSRQIAEARKTGLEITKIPLAWKSMRAALETGEYKFKPKKGLKTLANMLCAGEVKAPWEMGLAPKSGECSFEMDMDFIDAFNLFAMSAFDDRPQLDAFLKRTKLPTEWEPWVDEHIHV